MPIYEYRCAECGAQQEILQRISDAPLTDCPECGKPALKKLVSAAGFQLKGSGWYVTDFRNKSTKTDSKTGTKTETKSETKTESKTESTTETKPDTKSTVASD